MTLRLFLLFTLTVFTGQAWSIAGAFSEAYRYDGNNIDHYTPFGQQKYTYDVPRNLSLDTQVPLSGFSEEKVQSGPFFAFVDIFIATKSVTRTKKVEPIKDASGPHTTWKADPQTGQITRHETWKPNPRNPTGWDKVQSTDLKGAPHINKQIGEAIPTPHTQEKGIHGGVRPASPSEIPRGNH